MATDASMTTPNEAVRDSWKAQNSMSVIKAEAGDNGFEVMRGSRRILRRPRRGTWTHHDATNHANIIAKDKYRTCRPAFALCDFCVLPEASLGPALPPVDLPLPPAISKYEV